MKMIDTSMMMRLVGAMVGSVVGTLLGTIGWIISLSIIGSPSIIALINNTLNNLSASGWTLASILAPNGIVTAFIVLEALLLVIGGTIAGGIVGFLSLSAAYRTKK